MSTIKAGSSHYVDEISAELHTSGVILNYGNDITARARPARLLARPTPSRHTHRHGPLAAEPHTPLEYA